MNDLFASTPRLSTARLAAAAIAASVIGSTPALSQTFPFSGPQFQSHSTSAYASQPFSGPRLMIPGERGAMPQQHYQQQRQQYHEQAQPTQPHAAHMPEHLRRQTVNYTPRPAAPGTIIIDTANTYLYLVVGENRAVRYGIGVGREGFAWSGSERVARKAEWPDWRPPESMIRRQPYLPRFMAGGEGNPLGARALYLGDSIYRIHGTNAPTTIGQKVSSGCIRMLNEDVIDLYNRVDIGTRVVVLPDGPRTAPAAVARANTQPEVSSRQVAPQQRPTQIGANRTWRTGIY